jgi:hypothetical protein
MRKLTYEMNLENIENLITESSKLKPYISDGCVWIEKRKFHLK